MKLKDIPRTATFAWSPGQHIPIIATGTVAGALDASFSNTTELELFHLNLDKNEALELQPSGVVSSNARHVLSFFISDIYILDDLSSNVLVFRFDRLVWGISGDKSYGIIAGGMESGELDLWDPAIILEGGDNEKALLLRNTSHSGNVRGLQFNPFQNNLLASAATNGEIFIWDLTKPDKPYTPGTRSPKMEEITHLAWNNQVQHILATSSTTSYTVIWDLKNKREVMHLSYAGPSVSNVTTNIGRRSITAVAWNPDMATQIITASEDDSNPVIAIWDLRNAHAPEKILTGHQKGILSLSWCTKDADLLLSCGKDNRTLCWNPGTAEIIGELPPSSNWAFDVQWCPGNPDLLASASFDGKISIHSLQSSQDNNEITSISDNSDPFAISPVHQPSLSLKQPPKWLRRPVAANFGFGGKLVAFKSSAGPNKRTVTIYTIASEPEVIQRSLELESAVEENSLSTFCKNREKNSKSEFDEENWKILHTLFNDNENARELLVKHLGFSKADVISQISTAVKSLELNKSQQDEDDKVSSESTNFVDQDIVTKSEVDATSLDEGPSETKSENIELFSSNDLGEPSHASDLFSSEVIPDAFPIQSESLGSRDSSSFTAFNLGSFKIYPLQGSEVDKLITRSIVLGDFESAVNLCLETNRLSDAVLLAGCGGPELLQRTRKIYFEKQMSTVPYLRLLQSIVSGDLSDIVFNADLSEWQEVLVVLCTFAKSEEFGGLCNSLGQRLEKEYKKLTEPSSNMDDKSKGLSYRKNAVLCYLAAGNLENVVNIWITEQEEEESQEFKNDEQGEESIFSGSRYSCRAKSLQSLIEKIAVFRKAIDYVDTSLVKSLDLSSEGETNQQYDLSTLYDKYIEYAELLAAQGRLNTALKYLNLTPSDYKINSNESLIIRERLYHSGIEVKGTKEPLAPFLPVFVECTTSSISTTTIL
ncbi:4039_t:CDS:2 [Diversispora eburnea]|uniref:Protein transport protein SEC31 n=1 Tax=Diversispora eburnea TaxID=1213867 RepID=A0A9N9F6N6_9GLOM|nr:4039_t:CDS:2 [Diversispora eburnea]